MEGLPVRSAVKCKGRYLGHFVSGVPFDGEEQLWERLWHVNAVMPGEKQVNRLAGSSEEVGQKKTIAQVHPLVPSPVSPQEVLLLLRQLVQRVFGAQQAQLLCIRGRNAAVTRQSAALHRTQEETQAFSPDEL